MFDAGEGVVKDSVEAVRWYRKAAEQGMAEAQHNLGAAYLSGDGVPTDLAEAYFWWYLGAAASDDPRAIPARDSVGAKLTPEKRSEVEQRCRTWAATHTLTSN
jgi:TPR repeat protein